MLDHVFHTIIIAYYQQKRYIRLAIYNDLFTVIPNRFGHYFLIHCNPQPIWSLFSGSCLFIPLTFFVIQSLSMMPNCYCYQQILYFQVLNAKSTLIIICKGNHRKQACFLEIDLACFNLYMFSIDLACLVLLHENTT